jgi:hydroxyacyl-ACP dehydratase HTD2-like protein with hotdog domain
MREITIRRYADVSTGQALPGRTYRPNGLHVALMNFANWATHRIHYDKDWAQHDGFKNVVIQTGLLCSWIETMLVEWAGRPQAVRKVAFRNVALSFVDEEFEVGGEVKEMRSGNEVDVSTWVRRVDGQNIVTGTATLLLL